MKVKNNKLRSEIETSYNQEIKEKLRLNNTKLTNTIYQRFNAFQILMIQIVKELVHLLVVSTNQNNTN